jgi:L-lactate dehydrogenase complex protein LldG
MEGQVMSARDRILTKIKRQIAEGAPDARAAAVNDRLSALAQTAPRPSQSLSSQSGTIEQFAARAKAADATVSHISSLDDLPTALSHELRQRNMRQIIRMGADPALAKLDWSALEVSHGKGRIEEPATLSVAPMATAETGTLGLLSGPNNPVTLTFLGETHFVAVWAEDITPGMEEMWAKFRASGENPRTINLVTGPSRSADIGQTLQLGAHGPVALHIFIVGDHPQATH